MKNPITLSKHHLNQSQMTYFPHLYQAFSLGFVLIYAGIMSIIHAILPFLFPAKSAHQVTWMYVRVILDSKNPEIRKFKENELALREARLANSNKP